MSDDELDRLQPAHPSFAAHFTDPIYDPDDYQNDERPPFGSDEGWDEVHDWAERIDDLQAHPTLRYMLGDNAEGQMAELRDIEQIDVDDILIGQGFTLLRFTGQIDPEGRGWLLEVLQRQDARAPGGEYATLLQDLTSYGPNPGSSAQGDEASSATQSVGTKPWLSIKSVHDSELDHWFQQIAQAVVSDPGWRDWWTGSGLDYLVIQPSLVRAKHDHAEFRLDKNRLEVVGNSRKLSKMTRSLMKRHGNFFRTLAWLRSPEARELWQSLILRLLQEAGEHLGIGPPPDQLPV